MNTTHTQGEWTFDDNEIYSESTDHGAAICTMNTTSAHFTEEEVKANARLIAAAPDLLEALNNLHCLVMKLDNREIFDNSTNSEIVAKAKEAIQKATNL